MGMMLQQEHVTRACIRAGTCASSVAFRLCARSCSTQRSIARLAMSAALPWMTLLIACRSARARSA